MAESDARAAAALICQELRHYRNLEEDRDGTLGPAEKGYRVRAYRLGERMLLELSYEEPLGSAKKSVRVEFESPDDLVELSSALVLALEKGTPLPKNQAQAEVTPEPTSGTRVEPSVMMYAGIIGFSTVGDASATAGGADLGLSIPVGQFSLTPHARLAFGEVGMGAIGIDLRYYTSEADSALFVGAGLSAMGIGVEGDGGAGPTGSMLLGVEFNRTERTRVGVNLRGDFPAFTLDSGDYVVPVGLNLYLTL
jgi:hypothetical protein